MKNKLLALLASTVLAPGGLSVAAHATPDKATICHATGSESNPFVQISPSASGVFNGHLGAGHQNGEDIIPPFEYKGQTYSQNWDAVGQAIFNNGCEVPTEEPPVEEPPVEEPPVEEPPVEEPPVEEPPVGNPEPNTPPAGQPVPVPTAVDAGL